MIKSLFYKEWIKSRWVLLIIAVVFAGVIGYCFMNISRSMRVAGADHIWFMVVQKELTFADYIKYIPLFAGVLLALIQFIPEMISKRLKLTLHLPMPESRIFSTMLLFGIICLLFIYIISLLVLCLGLNQYFCTEVAAWSLSMTYPWFLGGLIAYLLTAWVCIEPVWRQRIFNTIIALLIISLFYFDEMPEAYNPFMPYLIVLIIVSSTFGFYSLIRFKDGEQ